MISAQAALNRLIDGNELFLRRNAGPDAPDHARELTPAQIAAILIGLRVKVKVSRKSPLPPR